MNTIPTPGKPSRQDNWDSLRPQIEYFSKPFPREAMAFANAHREEVAPHLVDALARVAANPTLVIDDPDYILHEYAMHLLATWRDTRAYAPLVALGHWDQKTLDAVLGDSLTETYGRCLATVCDGNLDPLKQLFADTSASHWARCAAMDAMVVRVMEGDAARDALVQYLIEQGDLEAQRLRTPGVVLAGLEVIDYVVKAACDVVAVELHSRIQSWFDDQLLDPMMMDRTWLDNCMNGSFEASRQRILGRGKGYVRDVVAEMGWWAGFRDKEPDAKLPSFFGRDPAEPTAPLVRSGPKIGRNDPCPCGSGKKYKKCCGVG